MAKYSNEMELFIYENYPHIKNNDEFAKLFNDRFNTRFTNGTLRVRANSLGVYKKGNRYTLEMLNFIKEYCHKIDRKELVNKFNECFGVNKTVQQIHVLCSQRGYSNKNNRKYTYEMIEFLRQNRRKLQINQLTNAFNNKFCMTVSAQTINDICQTNNIFRGYKKYNTGDECIDSAGRVLIKDKNNKWILKKEYIYEQKYSKIKSDETIIFIDGDNRNFIPQNLLKVKICEMNAMATFRFLKKDAQTTMLGLSLVRLKMMADKLEGRRKNKKRETQ